MACPIQVSCQFGITQNSLITWSPWYICIIPRRYVVRGDMRSMLWYIYASLYPIKGSCGFSVCFKMWHLVYTYTHKHTQVSNFRNGWTLCNKGVYFHKLISISFFLSCFSWNIKFDSDMSMYIGKTKFQWLLMYIYIFSISPWRIL